MGLVMCSNNPIFRISFWLLILAMSSVETVALLVNDSCINTTVSSPYYRENLFELIRQLNSSSSYTRFNSTSVGEPPDQVYGQYLCRGPLELCPMYITHLLQVILSNCPNPMEATVWYEHAMLRFSNYSFFGEYKVSAPNYVRCTADDYFSTMNTTIELDSYKEFMIANLFGVTEAVYKDRRMSAITNISYTTSPTSSIGVYIIAECTPDLSSDYCKSCLDSWAVDLPTKCYGAADGLVMYSSSCFIYYSIRDKTYYDDLTGGAYTPLDPAPVATHAPVSLPHPGNGSYQPVQPVQPVPSETKQGKAPIIGVIIAVAAGACVVIATIIFCILRRRAGKTHIALNSESENIEHLTAESLQYDLITLQRATDNFSDRNKIGKGGFGIVYKGVLANGQEIAVKRLTTNSKHNAEEFKNEVVLVAKLQHRNLVRLMGFCLAREEKMLVFEFVPNKSLDDILFDRDKKMQLDWRRRYRIIEGIARGLLYLHEDSRHRIIHRDLKADNILLDVDMNPKISDFGTARLIGQDESFKETQRVAGTLGYMAPEYLLQGQFSVKSDVYSFGVLTLEIISRKKVRSLDQSGVAQDLLNDAWSLWNEGEELKFVDETLKITQYLSNEVKKCIQLGLLCVQPEIDRRPTTASVVNMLNNLSSSILPVPQQPVCFNATVAESSSSSAGKGTSSHSSVTTSR